MAPYRLASFSRLAELPGIDLRVVFLKTGDTRRPWDLTDQELGFPHMVLSQVRQPLARLTRALFHPKPDVVIVGGWDHPAYLVPFLLKPFVRYRIVIWSESTSRDARGGERLRDVAKRTLVRLSDAVLVPGRSAEDYARSLRANRIFHAPNAIDAAAFEKPSAERPRSSDGRVLYVGRLASEKSLGVLLGAWRRVEERTRAELVLVGSGPEEARLKALCEAFRLKRVTWIPFLQPAELTSWYQASDVLVLPSRSEPWGFVVNEAMASGLPVVVSEAVGSAADLVSEGDTGWIVPVGDHTALAAKLEEALGDPHRRRRMGESAREKIRDITPERWAANVARMTREIT